MADEGSPHRLSASARTALDRLVCSTGELLETLDAVAADPDPATATGWSAVAIIVRRYLALLAEGHAADDAGIALRGANLLITVVKGVGDAELPGTDGRIAGLALAVTRDAIDAARALRADAELSF